MHFVSFYFTVTAESDKKVNDGEEIDMVDSSGAGVDYLMHRPEEETVMLLKNDERLTLSKSNDNKQSNNDKQTNGNCGSIVGSSSQTPNKRNNDEKLREKSAANDDKFTDLNRSGNNQTTTMTHTTAIAAKDSFVDDLDDDPYAELQSYLDKVKVSFISFFLFWYFFICKNVQGIKEHDKLLKGKLKLRRKYYGA